jgi:hypothetical protein
MVAHPVVAERLDSRKSLRAERKNAARGIKAVVVVEEREMVFRICPPVQLRQEFKIITPASPEADVPLDFVERVRYTLEVKRICRIGLCFGGR